MKLASVYLLLLTRFSAVAAHRTDDSARRERTAFLDNSLDSFAELSRRRDENKYSHTGSECKADCEIRHAGVTVLDWQRITYTATSTVVRYATAIEDSETLQRDDSGIPATKLVLLGNNPAASVTVDVRYPTPLTMYPSSYEWTGNLFTQIGDPQIGMIWTCLRDIKTPIHAKIVPPKDRYLWELGTNTTAGSEDMTNFDWVLAPRVQSPDTDHIKDLFPADPAMAQCRWQASGAMTNTPVPQFGIKYVTVISTSAEQSSAAVTPTAAPGTVSGIIVLVTPTTEPTTSTSVLSANSTSGTAEATPLSPSKSSRQHTGPVLMTVHTEKTATKLIIPTYHPVLEPTGSTADGIMPMSMVMGGNDILSPSASRSKVAAMPAKSVMPDAISPSASFTVGGAYEILKPVGPNRYVAQDGQVLTLNGPPVIIGGNSPSEPRIQLELVSDQQGQGHDVLVVNGTRQPLPASGTGDILVMRPQTGSITSSTESVVVPVSGSDTLTGGSSPKTHGRANPARFVGDASKVQHRTLEIMMIMVVVVRVVGF